MNVAAEGLASMVRTIAMAPADKKLLVFTNQAAEGSALVQRGYADKQEVADLLYNAAVSNGLVEQHGDDVVQQALAEGFAKPEIRTQADNQAYSKLEKAGHKDVDLLAGRISPASPAQQQVSAIEYGDFLNTRLPPRETLLAPWLPRRGLGMVHAPRGIGKTHVALGVAWAVATGGGFLRWTTPGGAFRVLLLDGEMPGVVLQERLRRVVEASGLEPPSPDYLKIAAADLREDGLPDLANAASQPFYTDIVADADLVVVDNLSTLCRSTKENDADSWSPVQSWCLSLRRQNKSVLLIHHDGKNGGQRGTSRREDVLDTVISLRPPPDYKPEDGARFEIHFEKSRGFFGPEAEAFEVKLVGNQWEESPIKSGDDLETVKSLRHHGMSIREIADRTGLSKSTVQRRLEGEDG